MDRKSRRDAVRDYKERKVPAGVFAVRCAASGEVWVGQSRNLDAQQNSVWFGLKMGSPVFRGPAAAWRQHGEASFAFEVLEVIDDEDMSPLGRDDALKRRERHWLDALNARKLTG